MQSRPSPRIMRALSLLLIAVLILLPWVFKLDGRTHADWLQFLGRFHPLAVHLPIGLLVLVPLLEIAGAFRPALREAAGFVLALAFLGCISALTLGYMLAFGGGASGTTVSRHMWGGIVLLIGALLCLLARPGWNGESALALYPVLLSAVLIALVWTSHQGSILTHGSNYLTAYMPQPLKHLIAPETAVAANSFYAMRINPILDANCAVCHGAGKSNGGLRVDSYELLMKGGKDGRVIVPREPGSSLLLERVTLPADHKQFMPADGKPALKPDEIALIRAWILQGASPSESRIAGISDPKGTAALPLVPVADYSSLMPEIQQLASSQGAKLIPVSSKPSDGLILNTVDIASSFNDAQLARFDKFAPYIVEAELARTAVTDASFDTLSRFTHLRALHLEGTGVTGSALGKLSSLSQLTYLNLSGTKVTSSAIVPLQSMKQIRSIYLFNTPAQPTAPPDEIQSKRDAQ